MPACPRIFVSAITKAGLWGCDGTRHYFLHSSSYRCEEMHLEMASREFAEIEIIREIAVHGIDVAVGIIDVKSYYIETPSRRC